MDRPPSQQENTRPSGLKQPSRLPAIANGGRTLLHETSQSDLNAKNTSGAGLMGPPPAVSAGSMKHKIPGLPEPPTKRKTLAERAGEPINPPRSHMPQPAKTSYAKSEAIYQTAGAGRQLPFMGNSFSTTGYRNTSNASTTSSSSGIRPASRQNIARPRATDPHAVLEETEEAAGVMGKRKGTPVLSFNPASSITIRKTRTAQDLRSPQHQHQPRPDMRAASQHSASYIRSLLSSTCSGSNSSSRSNSGRSTPDHQRNTSTSSSEPSSFQQEDSTTPKATSTRNTSLITAFADLSITPKPKALPPHYSGKLSVQRPSASKHRPSLSPVKESTKESPSKIPKFSCTPLLRHAQSSQALVTPLKSKYSTNGFRSPAPSISKRGYPPSTAAARDASWDTKGRLEDMESMYTRLRGDLANAADSKRGLEEAMELYKSRVQELTSANKEMTTSNKHLTSDLERARSDLHATTTDLRQARRDHERDMQDLERKHERDLSELYAKQERESQQLHRELEKIAEQGEKDLEVAKREWEKRKDDETADMTTRHWDEIEELNVSHRKEVERLEKEIEQLKKAGESRASESAGEVQELRDKLNTLESHIESAEATSKAMEAQITAAEARSAALEQEKAALISKTHFLEGNQEAQSHEFTTMRDQLSAAKASEEAVLVQLRREEMARRRLNAQILELKGNIRVFVRTRPLLAAEAEEAEPAKVEYPDLDSLDGGKEMVVQGPKQQTATGKERVEKHNYAFDRVFSPSTANTEVFAECRELIQSVVDGYNVSILSYGQTGSGKTYGMSGPEGIIPSSIALLLEEMRRLKAKGWKYTVDAAFVEVYNETLNDLLGDAKTWDETGAEDLGASTRASAKKREKHEIHHDPVTGKTTVTNLSSVPLWPPPTSSVTDDESSTISYTERAVTNLLDTAAKNRRVAATKSNERSSRSHSIFMLTLKGSCAATNEASEGVLNLVDLAGSERLKQSGAAGNQLKETQAINKSLSSLGDVIASLGSKKGDESHVPYRNSKLTYLLQSSLGGTAANGKSSRTLMLLHLSPLLAHWQESRSSLVFGNKVHGTHIGAAKKR
ncbi:kinesin-like nuclear fusion protein [Saxophila tyrrhenica]|uniref:Kinesin-like nuclear fusion protein n=1 Tax=Saxophila tyrrhenica TaxID=1690608 RepID=A0AAV9PNV2_9PEZI|nr:kinesin-like nuclear fusion protein [Saxophila tyrrhenica]